MIHDLYAMQTKLHFLRKMQYYEEFANAEVSQSTHFACIQLFHDTYVSFDAFPFAIMRGHIVFNRYLRKRSRHKKVVNCSV